MSLETLLTLVIVGTVLVLLATTAVATDVVLIAAMIVISVLGIVSADEALAGFANPGVITIAALYVVVAGLRETGAIAWVSHRVFGHPRSVPSAQLRLMGASGLISSLVNNTPVVAMFIPIAQDWAVRLGLPVSRLLLPLNNVAILAGTCTLIGTSTNLVVNGLLMQTHPAAALGLFDLVRVGVPLTLIGIVYTLTLGRWLLPTRAGAVEQLENAREYSFEARVRPGGPVAGKTIAQVGFRSMKKAYLAEIERNGELMTAVAPSEILRGGDILTFVGVADGVQDLRRVPGLDVAEEQSYTLNLRKSQRCLVELVLSAASPLVDLSVREAGFRGRYQAVILSISREGRRLDGKLGDVQLRVGDTLLVETDAGFASRHRYNREFLLVSPLQDSAPPDFSRAPVAAAILVAMVAVAALNLLPLFEASFIAAGLMVASGCVTLQLARRSIEYPVVIGIAASFALGTALMQSGAAELGAGLLAELVGEDPFLALCAIYVVTVVVTEVITNSAAAVLMFPLALAAAEQTGANFMPFVIAVMIAASAGFVTPIGYQTNMMIYGPGGYRFSDFVRFGLPLSAVVAAAALMIIPRVWPL